MTARILIIAGSDSGGGAGIQADIKTVTMLGGHAMTAITAVTAQNTLGVSGVHPIPTAMVIAQIDAVVSDIGVDAVKIGMIGSAETAVAVADRLAALDVPIVFDPVMVATSGDALADGETINAFKRLMGLATITTPNLPELKLLSGMSTIDAVSIWESARSLVNRFGCAILAKGGHARGKRVTDRLVSKGYGQPEQEEWSDIRVETSSTHGTGCTLASAIAVGLAQGMSLSHAVLRARQFVRLALREAPGLGAGHGPMGHQNVRLDLPLNPPLSSPMLNQITVAATDYEASVAFYARLGLEIIVAAPPRYARMQASGGATLSIEVMPDASLGSSVIYLECDHLDLWVDSLKISGLTFDQMPRDEEWLWREARLRDPHGNVICLYHAGENRRYPPWRVHDRRG